MARRRKPQIVKEQQGTNNVTRDKDEIADSKALAFVHNELVSAPEGMPPTGVDLWNRQLSQAMQIYGYVSFIDLKLLEEYCHTYALLHSIRGRLYNPPKKDYDSRADWMNYHKLATRFDKLSSEFGFSPAGRTRIKLEQKEKEEFDEFEDGL